MPPTGPEAPSKTPTVMLEDDDMYQIMPLRFDISGLVHDGYSVSELKSEMKSVLTRILLELAKDIDGLTIKNVKLGVVNLANANDAIVIKKVAVWKIIWNLVRLLSMLYVTITMIYLIRSSEYKQTTLLLVCLYHFLCHQQASKNNQIHLSQLVTHHSSFVITQVILRHWLLHHRHSHQHMHDAEWKV